MRTIVAYTDGSCDNSLNKKRAGAREGGWGAVIQMSKQDVRELSVGTYINSNSARMEIRAIVAVLALCKKGAKLTIWSDNKYAVDAYDEEWVFRWEYQEWSGRKNADLWQEFLIHERQLIANGGSLKLRWVKGHAGHPMNERADVLANEARKRRIDLIDDKQEW